MKKETKKVSQRKFYRTVIQVEILSEEPYDNDNLSEIADDVTVGNCSGKTEIIEFGTEIGAKRAVKLLKAQGSDPEFFQLDNEGRDI